MSLESGSPEEEYSQKPKDSEESEELSGDQEPFNPEDLDKLLERSETSGLPIEEIRNCRLIGLGGTVEQWTQLKGLSQRLEQIYSASGRPGVSDIFQSQEQVYLYRAAFLRHINRDGFIDMAALKRDCQKVPIFTFSEDLFYNCCKSVISQITDLGMRVELLS